MQISLTFHYLAKYKCTKVFILKLGWLIKNRSFSHTLFLFRVSSACYISNRSRVANIRWWISPVVLYGVSRRSTDFIGLVVQWRTVANEHIGPNHNSGWPTYSATCNTHRYGLEFRQLHLYSGEFSWCYRTHAYFTGTRYDQSHSVACAWHRKLLGTPLAAVRTVYVVCFFRVLGTLSKIASLKLLGRVTRVI